ISCITGWRLNEVLSRRRPEKVAPKTRHALSNVYIRPLLTRAEFYRRAYPIAHHVYSAYPLGLIASLPVHQIVRSTYGASLYHPLTFAAVICILLSVAGVDAYLPARRALRGDPTSVLKRE